MYDDTERRRRIRDGAALLRHVLGQDTHPNLVRRVLLEVFWFVSESDGKYGTRYESEGSLALRKNDPLTWRRERQHEHVYTRRSLSQRLADGEEPLDVLEDAHGCVVTKAEHALLSPFDRTHTGWERYRQAGVHVIDTATGEQVV